MTLRQWTEELDELLLDVAGRFATWSERAQEFVNVLERRDFTRAPSPPFTAQEMQSHFKELCESVPIEVSSSRAVSWSAKRVELLFAVNRNTPGESYEVKTVLFNHAIKEKGWTFKASLEQVKKKLLAATNRRGLNATVLSILPVQPRVAQTVEANPISTKRTRQQIDARDQNPKQQKVGTGVAVARAAHSSVAASSNIATAAVAVGGGNFLGESEEEDLSLSMDDVSGAESDKENEGGCNGNNAAHGRKVGATGATCVVTGTVHSGAISLKSAPTAAMTSHHGDDEGGSDELSNDGTSDGTQEQETSADAEKAARASHAKTGDSAGTDVPTERDGDVVGSGASGLGNMADYLRSLVNNKLMSDVAFLVEGSEVFAHRCICMRCDYFKITLAEEIVNSNVGRVEISGVSRRAFLSVLEYIYTDSLDVSEDMVMEMFTTADRFGIETLKQHCSRRLMKSVGVHNVADVLLIADELGHASLRDECFAYTLRNLEAVSKTKSFQEMAHRNPNMMVKIVQELSART